MCAAEAPHRKTHNSDCCDTTFDKLQENAKIGECVFTEIKNTSPIVCPNIKLCRKIILTQVFCDCKRFVKILDPNFEISVSLSYIDTNRGGLGAKMFIIAGPVLVYGITASAVYGLILWVVGFF